MSRRIRRTPPTLVLGLGRSGYSVVAHLASRGEDFAVADSRTHPPMLAKMRKRHPKIEVLTGCAPFDKWPARRFAHFERVVVSPGLPPPRIELPAEDGRSVEVVGDIELFADCLRESRGAPVIGVTGSNGKSTVTTMVAAVVEAAGQRAHAGGNLGPPALDLLALPRPDVYVIELSSFQLQTTRRVDLAAAAILNLSEDHLDRHPDMASYAAAKARILRHAEAAVLNRDDANLADLRAAHPNAVTFGLNPPPGARHFGLVDTADGQFLCRGVEGGGDGGGVERLAAADKLTAPGAHNIANALAALALVEAAGVAVSPAAAAGLYAYRGLEHRCELVADIGGVKWVNDSKATNVGATVAAIAGLRADDGGDAVAGKNPGLILIAGGLGKGADFAPLRAPVERHVDRVALFGNDAPRLAEALAGAARIARVTDLRAAVTAVAEVARPGQTVLFSPACASFDQFADYQARGEAFKQLVAELAANIDAPAAKPAAKPRPALGEEASA